MGNTSGTGNTDDWKRPVHKGKPQDRSSEKYSRKEPPRPSPDKPRPRDGDGN